jgi:L-seryl-tRNA(Ser) seleniumtransferase
MGDPAALGLPPEPSPAASLREGAHLVAFSGDKLLGGPQAGVILGNREVVGDLRKNPLTRALRPDKMTLTALEATLRLYLDEPRALMEIPTLRMLTRPVAELDRQARALARRVRRRFGARLQVEVVESEGRAGGGTLPQAPLPSRALAITIPPLAPQELEVRLHRAATPVIGRVERGVVILDLLTALPGDQEALMAALAEVLAEGDPLA